MRRGHLARGKACGNKAPIIPLRRPESWIHLTNILECPLCAGVTAGTVSLPLWSPQSQEGRLIATR